MALIRDDTGPLLSPAPMTSLPGFRSMRMVVPAEGAIPIYIIFSIGSDR